jgi:oligosaccharyltransferase complex subunit beta
LEERGHILTIINPLDDVSPLKNYDRLLFDNIFVFASSVHHAIQGFPKPSEFLDFVETGGSLFIAPTDGHLSPTFRDIALSYGIDYLPATSMMLNTIEPANAIVSLPMPKTKSEILGDVIDNTAPIQVTGLAMSILDNVTYIKKVLTGLSTMIVFDPGNPTIFENGPNISLLSAVQLKNNARMIFFSDISLLSNQFLSAPNTSNHVYLNAVCWVTHDCGYVRVKTFQHYMFDPVDLDGLAQTNRFINNFPQILSNKAKRENFLKINPATYKVGEHVHFDVVLERYNPYSKVWELTQSNDVVFEMKVLHPFIKFPLEPQSQVTLDAKKTSLLGQNIENVETRRQNSTQKDVEFNMPFQITMPDEMGVFRIFLSTKEAFNTVEGSGVSFFDMQESPLYLPVRPPKHDEWTRFLFVAYPYYLSMIIIMGAFFVLSVAFLYTK